MSQTLTLPGDIYRKLAQGAAERGMTIESLLACVSELIVVPLLPTEQDRQRLDRIDRLLDRYRTGQSHTDPERLPDGPWLDEGIPAPFDLPRPGLAERVEARIVRERLPELPTALLEGEA